MIMSVTLFLILHALLKDFSDSYDNCNTQRENSQI